MNRIVGATHDSVQLSAGGVGQFTGIAHELFISKGNGRVVALVDATIKAVLLADGTYAVRIEDVSFYKCL